MVIHDLLGLRGIPMDAIDGEAVSSVVPQLVSEYRGMFARYLDRDALIVGPGPRPACRSASTTPASSGADRLVNAVAGYERYPRPA